MEKISINQIKKNFAHWAKLAAEGEAIQITKYNRPYLQLTQITESGLRYGKHFGKTSLKSALKHASKGRYLSVLSEDRGDV